MPPRRKKPVTPEEIESDIENNPERGLLRTEDGRLVSAVRTDNKEVRGYVSHEIYELLLDIWGAKGLDKSDGIRDMASLYVSHLGNLQLVERSEQVKSEVFGVSRREVRSKKKGYYKSVGRELKARLTRDTENA